MNGKNCRHLPGYLAVFLFLFACHTTSAQKSASAVPLIIGSYQNATWDFTLYTEGMLTLEEKKDGRRIMKLIPLENLANKTPMDPSYMSTSVFIHLSSETSEGECDCIAGYSAPELFPFR